jgi:hypothetical protein
MNQKNILQAFLDEKLSLYDLELDQEVLNTLNTKILLEERELPEEEQVKTAYIRETSSGEPTAEHFSLYNLARVSIHDLMVTVMKSYGVWLFTTPEKVWFAFLLLLLEFYPKLKVKLDKQDARVLSCIAKLEKKELEAEEVAEVFLNNFKEALPKEKLDASLDFLTKLRVLKRTAKDQYIIRDLIVELERN